MKACIVGIFALLTVFFGAVTASACECAQRRSVGEEIKASEHVVMVFLSEVQEDRASLIVLTTYKGGLKPDDKIVFEQGAGRDCKWQFNSQDRYQNYLFYLPKRPENGVWQASACSRSGALDDVEDDLNFIWEIRMLEMKKLLKPLPPPQPWLKDDWRPTADPRMG